jgi:hypothetical protein
MVWTGTGQLIGNSDDFLTLAYEKYGIELNPSMGDLESLSAESQEAATAEVAAKGKFCAPSTERGGPMVKVAMVKPNSTMPAEHWVREEQWKGDMDRLLGKEYLLSDSIEVMRTATSRIFVWFNSNAEFKERKNKLATLALTSSPSLVQMCFRYCLHGAVSFYALKLESDSPVNFSAEEFDATFCSPEMDTFQQEMASVRIQASYKGRASRKTSQEQMAKKKKEEQDKLDAQELEDAAVKIQSRFKGHAKRKEMEEEALAATNIQARFRGNKLREKN